MKPCDIEFYEDVIGKGQKVRVHVRSTKETPEGIIVKESERVIIIQVYDGLCGTTKRRMIYKAAISMVEEL